jgi:tRNA(fMet)-specific endonuclease VapC
MNKAILDTDVLSAVMRQDENALAEASKYLAVYSYLSISTISRFEILRGLYAKQADSQIAAFDVLCQSLEIMPLTDSVVVRASQIYGDLYRSGRLIGDADILIAATCLEAGYDCVTNNTSHFTRVDGLEVRNWLDKR